MIGIKIENPLSFFVTVPLLDLIFVGWLEIFDRPVSYDFLPTLAALWIGAVIFKDLRS